MSNQEIVDRAINVLEKDAAIMTRLTELGLPLMLTQIQKDILLGLSKLSMETMELLKTVKV